VPRFREARESILQEQPMVLILPEMFFQQVTEHIKKGLSFAVGHPLDQGPGEGVVSYFLQIVNECIFIRFTV
jgi:hypothetical protein